MTASHVRVVIHAVAPEHDAGAVEAAYHRISRDLQGTPGLIGNELLRSVAEHGDFVVMSEWESLDAFRSWEAGAAHRQVTAPLRPYQKAGGGTAVGIYEVAAAY
ncbi:antibiotic biosynthesis monooxygenase family protein [Actinoallomurus iriomotensis]|uniref:Antibiotic biosynthesis monooxygenase n=1 Tax=Actinoallomurus iriomotensis TaxID=478107 RepID=A0A9W6S0U6_9ACTN|nr:antibiotic biosynthesis monooxygenase [Actinoallomurus iriomotensis]GLY75512.1 antibiotic biosynthesis monooxygenase [Actinoallomurus iriomotensis]GLY85123.1 antibiotic biosynthesis monooxygenase [Actinoallomurus iriomotensis]